MDKLIKASTFYDDGRNKREKESFQGFFFNGIDMSKRTTPISFIRSDFRGAKLHEMIFSKNNFSNADFIDSSVVKSKFDNCQFKYSELYNSYFESSNFSDTAFNSASLVKLVFEGCNFLQTKFEVNTFRECRFSNCKLVDSDFAKNSMDDIEFEKTTFTNIDLSNMTAINLFFNDCQFENVIIDADYLGSYFFKGKFFENVKLKYRGKVFDLDINQSDLLNNLFKILLEKERYYEAINIAIQKNLLEQKHNSIFSLIESITSQLLKEKSQLKRSYQFDKIFKLLEYYLNTGYISILDYFKVLGHFENLNVDHFGFLEQIGFSEKVNRIKIILDKIELTNQFLETGNTNEKVLLEIKIDENDQNVFEKRFDKSIHQIGYSLSIDETPYEVIGQRKGSLIYDIMIYSGIALVFLKLLKSIIKTTREIMHESVHLAIDYRLDSKTLSISSKIKGRNELIQIKDIKQYQILSKKVLSKDAEVDMEELKQLLPLLKSAVVYPNALTNGK